MKLLAFSDLHCDHDQAGKLVEMSADVDLVIGAGDFASVHKGLKETLGTLKTISKPALLVPGNNETDQALREAAAEWPSAVVLHGEITEIDGVEFFGLGGGIPVTPWDWSFDLDEPEAEAALASCPPQCVLITHSPPKGQVDGQDNHFGSESILAAIEEKQPRLAVCGHIHECWGRQGKVGETPVFNLGPMGREFEI